MTRPGLGLGSQLSRALWQAESLLTPCLGKASDVLSCPSWLSLGSWVSRTQAELNHQAEAMPVLWTRLLDCVS